MNFTHHSVQSVDDQGVTISSIERSAAVVARPVHRSHLLGGELSIVWYRGMYCAGPQCACARIPDGIPVSRSIGDGAMQLVSS